MTILKYKKLLYNYILSDKIRYLGILLVILQAHYLITKHVSYKNPGYNYRVIHRSVDKLKLNYPTYYKGKRNKFLIDRMEI